MLPGNLSQYPITNHLSEICSALKNSASNMLILTAETAAGKSTVLPLALIEEFHGKIIMTEPRRIAVLGVANRLAELKGEECGKDSVGYKIHLENKTSDNNRLEVVTEAVLVRQLQKDPALENYNVVVIDEFHERSVNTDLALAFLKEALELRNDLFVIIMSATIDTEKLQSYLGENTPVLQIPGRQFSVKEIYEPELSIENAVLKAIGLKQKGNVLVFLPGIKEIRKAEGNLKNILQDDVDLFLLHSSISLAEPKKVLVQKDKTKRRVILSSAIAETSLTVPGVNCVIDLGLARVNRMNISTGMENLTTETESEFSAEQRKGRAGRLEEGICVRLWSQFDPRIQNFAPEILRADITSVVLECAERGVFSEDGIDWLDKPNSGAWKEAQKLLRNIGMLKEDFHITEKGKQAVFLGLHPRLSGIALSAFDGQHINTTGTDLLIKYGNYSESSAEIQKKFIQDLEKRLVRINCKSDVHASGLILQGYPDRLARRVSEPGVYPAEYQFSGGRKAVIREGYAPEWICAPEVLAGNTIGTIFEFEPVPDSVLDGFLESHKEKRETCVFVDGKIQKTEEICFGEIVLSSKKIKADSGDIAAAWANEVKIKGITCLPLNEKTKNFILRVEFFRQQRENSDISLEEELKNSVREWLLPFLASSNTLTSQIIYDSLYWYLNGNTIDSEVPEVMILPNGKRCKIKYEKQSEIRPVIEIIIQKIFGCYETPEICGKKVLLRLLSPAGRPLQITEDLKGFWSGSWPEICKEMKGRYPKHNWDYKIADKED